GPVGGMSPFRLRSVAAGLRARSGPMAMRRRSLAWRRGRGLPGLNGKADDDDRATRETCVWSEQVHGERGVELASGAEGPPLVLPRVTPGRDGRSLSSGEKHWLSVDAEAAQRRMRTRGAGGQRRGARSHGAGEERR